jgi:hypothetical protein
LIDLALDDKNTYHPNARSQEIRDLTNQVAESNNLIIPTDKTNSFTTMEVNEYKQKVVIRHLLKDGKVIPRERLTEAHEQSIKLMESIDHPCSKNETDFIQESLKFKAIPSPKLLVKGRKKKDKWGQYPTRLVIPATNFTSAFPEHMAKTIIQAYPMLRINLNAPTTTRRTTQSSALTSRAFTRPSLTP